MWETMCSLENSKQTFFKDDICSCFLNVSVIGGRLKSWRCKMALTAWQYQHAATRDCKDMWRLCHWCLRATRHIPASACRQTRQCQGSGTWQTAWRRIFAAERGKVIRRRVVPTSAVPENWQVLLCVDDNKTELFSFLASNVVDTRDGNRTEPEPNEPN